MRIQNRLFLAMGLNTALILSIAVVVSGSGADGRSASPAAAAAEFRIDRRDLRDYEEVTGTIARTEEFRVLQGASAAQPGPPPAELPAAGPVAQYSSVSPSSAPPSPSASKTSSPGPSGTAPPNVTPSASQPVQRTVTVTVTAPPVPGPTVTVTAPGQVMPQSPGAPLPTRPQGSAPPQQSPQISTNQPKRPAVPPQPGATTALTPQTVTALAPIASRIRTGSLLYSADDQPVIAIVSKTTFWRELSTGVAPGADVEVLERALQDLGFAEGLKVDRNFTSATATAVAHWEEKIGRSKKDGRVSLGEVVTIPVETEVAQHLVPVGGSIQSLNPVLSLAAEDFIIKAEITPESSSKWPIGQTVDLSIGQGTKLTGKVDTQNRSATAEKLQLRILPGKTANSWKTGAEVRIVLVREIRKQVLCVPVSFPRANAAGQPIIRIRVSGQVVERPVSLGLVSDGWVQISGDFTEDQELAN